MKQGGSNFIRILGTQILTGFETKPPAGFERHIVERIQVDTYEETGY
jgi:hypothetical protein